MFIYLHFDMIIGLCINMSQPRKCRRRYRDKRSRRREQKTSCNALDFPRDTLPMPEFYHIPIKPDFEPRFDVFSGAILPIQSDESYTMIHFGGCFVVVGNIEHHALLCLQQAEYSNRNISNEIK